MSMEQSNFSEREDEKMAELGKGSLKEYDQSTVLEHHRENCMSIFCSQNLPRGTSLWRCFQVMKRNERRELANEGENWEDKYQHDYKESQGISIHASLMQRRLC